MRVGGNHQELRFDDGLVFRHKKRQPFWGLPSGCENRGSDNVRHPFCIAVLGRSGLIWGDRSQRRGGHLLRCWRGNRESPDRWCPVEEESDQDVP